MTFNLPLANCINIFITLTYVENNLVRPKYMQNIYLYQFYFSILSIKLVCIRYNKFRGAFCSLCSSVLSDKYQ